VAKHYDPKADAAFVLACKSAYVDIDAFAAAAVRLARWAAGDAMALSNELASEVVRGCDPRTGRIISDITRREIEPLRLLAVKLLAALGAAPAGESRSTEG
jgi:hypothetical protein